MKPIITIILILTICQLVKSDVQYVPLQYFYNSNTLNQTIHKDGCIQKNWEGLDQEGVAGQPWFSTFNCSQGNILSYEGVVIHGHLQFYVHDGEINYKVEFGKEEYVLKQTSSSFWINEGVWLKIDIRGFVSVTGAKFELKLLDVPSLFTSNYAAKKHKQYLPKDAYDVINGARVMPDTYINTWNGTSNAWNLLYSTTTNVEPPSVVILVCSPEHSFMQYHSRQQGALYVPFTGELCFLTDQYDCIHPGEARWTSPNLYYYEQYNKINETNASANELIKSVLSPDNAKNCEYPITFAVTNWDPDTYVGQPNTVDVPENGKYCQQWGYWEKLTVRSTQKFSRTIKPSDRRVIDL